MHVFAAFLQLFLDLISYLLFFSTFLHHSFVFPVSALCDRRIFLLHLFPTTLSWHHFCGKQQWSATAGYKYTARFRMRSGAAAVAPGDEQIVWRKTGGGQAHRHTGRRRGTASGLTRSLTIRCVSVSVSVCSLSVHAVLDCLLASSHTLKSFPAFLRL